MKKFKNGSTVNDELQRILSFIGDFPEKDEQVVVPVSGGLDSDLVARLCCRSLGSDRVKLFIVVQSDMELKFLQNARALAQELGTTLAEVHLECMNQELMKALEQGEPGELFDTKRLLNLAKAKCSVRSSVISCYQDKGFLIAGTTNRSEKELGFFLTFGDNLAHFKPIAHLYKSELYPLAEAVGTHKEVLEQKPSAGFWSGQTDMEDLAYWIVNDGPIVIPRDFTDEEEARVRQIKAALTYERIDDILKRDRDGCSVEEIIRGSALSSDIVIGIIHIVEKAKKLKNREIMLELSLDRENSHALQQTD